MGDQWSVVPYHADQHDVFPLYTSEEHFLHADFHGPDRNPTLSDIYYPLLPLEINDNPTALDHPPSSGDFGLLNWPDNEHVVATLGQQDCTVGNSFPTSTLSTARNMGSGGANLGYGGHVDGSGPAPADVGPTECSSGPGPSAVSSKDMSDLDKAVPLPSWPMLPYPYLCSCCHVLREIIHTNGNHMTKLELHGRPGMIIHAILEDQPGNHIEDVKEFLLQYCEEKRLAGYKLIPDPLSMYYEAVCVGLVWDDIIFSDQDFFQSSPLPSEVAAQASGGPPENTPWTDQQSYPPVQNNQPHGTNPRTSLAKQRERAGKLTLRDMAHYFHLPLENAAEILELCPTVVKKICRRGGLRRWPHRKIRSLQKQIRKLQPRLGSGDPMERQAAEAEIESLQQQMSSIRYGVPEVQV
ncbi:hypothetical protein SAY86_012214 [Trapa natans]|uniref:RWP-RK domain-containing protein n=1 Tax=Trapa natans TaxID=22666 RepID=A0AAN7LWS5_TRANT|nr:hypothetical protein SAY86_012214 [Trapa natans]